MHDTNDPVRKIARREETSVRDSLRERENTFLRQSGKSEEEKLGDKISKHTDDIFRNRPQK